MGHAPRSADGAGTSAAAEVPPAEVPAAEGRPAGGVVALFGPTGVGKTAVGIEVARRCGSRVISCDSMQLYRGLPVLTNQPTAAERAAVPHVLIDEVDPTEEWSVALYAEHAQRLVDEDVARGGWAVVVGGTGLYLRAALAPLAIPDVYDPAVRAALMERGENEGSTCLHAELALLDPQAAAAIHPHNLRRVVRALEVVQAAGPGSWSSRSDLWEPSYRHPTILFGITMDRRELYARIDARVGRMLAGGAIEEVAAHRSVLRSHGAGTTRSPTGVAKALGYEAIVAYLDGSADLDETAARMAAATRRYARRQLTWLRRLRDAVIIDTSGRHPADVAAEIVAIATHGRE